MILMTSREHGGVRSQGSGDAGGRTKTAATAGVRQRRRCCGTGQEMGVVSDGRDLASGGHGVIRSHEAVGDGGVAVKIAVRVTERAWRVERIRRCRGVEVHPWVLLLPFRASILKPNFHLAKGKGDCFND